MNYVEAVNYINDVSKYGSTKGLESIERLLEKIDNPHERLKFIHIGGTNGKGSNASYIGSMLKAANYVVGSFISPYLEKMNERFQINSIEMSDEDLIIYTEIIKRACDEIVAAGFPHPTSFEIVTAMGMRYFADTNCDYVVLEVGIGGRSDCTNIISTPVAAVITTIGMDHMDVLGNTLPAIAWEKAGIIKSGGLAFTFTHSEDVDQVISAEAVEKNAELFYLDENNIKVNSIDAFGANFDFTFSDEVISDVQINLVGQHQVKNASLSLMTILELRARNIIEISDEEIRRGLAETRWPGRFEVLDRDPLFVIDGAHNIEGIEALTNSIKLFDYDRLILGISILHDKEYEKMLGTVASVADEIIITEVDYSRRTKAEDMAEVIGKFNPNYTIEKNIPKAIDLALEKAGPNDLILFAGSLYLIGDIRRIYKNKKTE